MERFRLLRSSVSTFLTFFFLLVIFGSTAYLHPTHAQQVNPWRFDPTGASYDNCDGSQKQINGECYVDRTATALEAHITCLGTTILGICTNDVARVGMLEKRTLVWRASEVIGATFDNKPASTYAFIQDMGQSLGFIPKQTYAQGVGFTGLAPLLPLWKAFRNIAYALLALVMIVVGFMVMLRKKIDPKTVVTVQNSLPRIVITLILITFSYAIVGIAIDLMYVVIVLVALLFQNTGLLTLNTEAKLLSGQNIFNPGSLPALYTKGDLLSVLSNIKVTPTQILFGLNESSVPGAVTSLIQNFVHGITTNIFGELMRGLGSGLALIGLGPIGLIYMLAMLFIFIRLTVLFVSSYIQIIISLITAPLQILMEAFPGSSSFSGWLKNLIANIVVFPIAATMFMLANVFGNFANNAGGTNLWLPPYTGMLGNTTSLMALIGFGLLFAIPQIAGSVKETLKAKPAVNAGPGAIFGPIGMAGGQAMQLAYQGMFISSGLRHKPPSGGTTPIQRQVDAGKTGGVGQVLGGPKHS